MTIDEIITQKESSDSEHDREYAKAIRIAHKRYKKMNRVELYMAQQIAQRAISGNLMTHEMVANCMIIAKLLGEI